MEANNRSKSSLKVQFDRNAPRKMHDGGHKFNQMIVVNIIMPNLI